MARNPSATEGAVPEDDASRWFGDITYESILKLKDADMAARVAKRMSQEGYVQTAAIAREQALKLGKTESEVPPPPEMSMDDISSQMAQVMNEVEVFTQQQARCEAPSASSVVVEAAEAEKEKGNAAFKDGRVLEAEQHYTRSLEFHGYNPVALSNRALCRIKLGRAADAEQDAAQAIAMDPEYVKAYYRRALARKELSNIRGAIQDLERVMELAPGTTNVPKELEELRNMCASNAPSSAAAAYIPLRSGNKVQIEEIVSDSDDVHAPVPPPSAARPKTKDQPRRNSLPPRTQSTRRSLHVHHDAGDNGTESSSTATIKEEDAAKDEVEDAKSAIREKDMGNELFKQGDVHGAIAAYTRSLRLDPGSAAVLSNRAAAHLKVADYAQADSDASAAILLEPGHVKAHHRRGMARVSLGRLRDAMDDLQIVQNALPDHEQVREAVVNLRKHLAQAKPNPTVAATPAKSVRHHPERRRLVIEEETDEESEPEAPYLGESSPQARDVKAGNGAFATPPTVTQRRRLVVTEESDSDEDAMPAQIPAATKHHQKEDDGDDNDNDCSNEDIDYDQDGRLVKSEKHVHWDAASPQVAFIPAKQTPTPKAFMRPPTRRNLLIREESDEDDEAEGVEGKNKIEDADRVAESQKENNARTSTTSPFLRTPGVGTCPGSTRRRLVVEEEDGSDSDQEERQSVDASSQESQRATPSIAASQRKRLVVTEASSDEEEETHGVDASRQLEYEQEEREANTEAEELLQQYLAAIFRRAQARRVLGRINDALADYRTLLAAFPDNPDVLREVTELEALLVSPPAQALSANSRTSELRAEGSMDREGRDSAAAREERDSLGPPHEQHTRLVVEEDSDSDSGSASGQAASCMPLPVAASASAPPTSTSHRRRLVIEESDSEAEDADQPENLEANIVQPILQPSDSEAVRAEAEREKEAGNTLFRAGDLQGAIECYRRSIEMDASNPAVHANCAAAHLKAGTYDQAEASANNAIRLDGSHIKAFHRRAAARAALGNFSDALADYNTVLKALPNNPQVMEEIQKLEWRKGLERPISTSPKGKPATHAQVPTSIIKAPPSPSVSRPPAPPKPPLSPKPASCVETLSAPKSVADFERCCRQLLARKDTRQLAAYVRLVEPSNYATFFKDSLEATHLKAIVFALSDDSYINDVEKTVETLRAISQVKRFDMAVMLIPKCDKHAFSKIFDAVATNSPTADLAYIRACFKL